MSDLISRSALQRTIKRSQAIMIDGNYYVRMNTVIDKILAAPDIDAVPVVHAMWIREKHGIVRCSCCNKEYKITNGVANALQFFYCPNCGAKMDGGDAHGQQDDRT